MSQLDELLKQLDDLRRQVYALQRLEHGGGGPGSVTSVNGDTGVVVLDADDISDSGTTHKFTTAAEITKLAGIEALADVTDAGNVGAVNAAAASKNPPIDADSFPIVDSAASNVIKRVTFTNLKAFLKTYFDTLYGLLATANTWTANNAFNSTATSGSALSVTRNLTSASTDSPVVSIVQDNTGDDQDALSVKQDGTGDVLELLDGATVVLRVVDGGRLEIAQVIRALTSSGLRLEDDGGNLGVFVEDGGQVGIANATPGYALDVTGTANVSGFFRSPGVVVTIASGAITATGSYHAVNTEAAAATDDLDTINGGTYGEILILRTNSSSRTVVVKDATGNIRCTGDRTLNHTDDQMMLIFNSAFWCEVAYTSNT